MRNPTKNHTQTLVLHSNFRSNSNDRGIEINVETSSQGESKDRNRLVPRKTQTNLNIAQDNSPDIRVKSSKQPKSRVGKAFSRDCSPEMRIRIGKPKHPITP